MLTEIVFPADANVLTVDQYEQRPERRGKSSLGGCPGRCEQCRYGDHLRNGSGQAFATPQTITLEAPLDVSDTNSVGIEGPSWGVTLVGDYSQSRFPILSVAQDANVLIQGVSIGTQSPGANGDLQVAGVLDVIEHGGEPGIGLERHGRRHGRSWRPDGDRRQP